jgi:hypothetical protein
MQRPGVLFNRVIKRPLSKKKLFSYAGDLKYGAHICSRTLETLKGRLFGCSTGSHVLTYVFFLGSTKGKPNNST